MLRAVSSRCVRPSGGRAAHALPRACPWVPLRTGAALAFAEPVAPHRAISSTAALHAPRSLRALEMKYVDGSCTLSVPLPLSGFDEERVFSISPEAKVSDIISQIEAEDATLQSVELRTKRGKSYKPDDSLEKVLKDDFELVINDRVLPVTAPVFTGDAYASLVDDGDLDVRSVTHKAAVISLRKELETIGKWKITYGDFVDMCRSRGIPKKQAPEILKAFHQSGIVFFFGKSRDDPDADGDLQYSVFLQPRAVLDSYLASLGLTPLTTQRFEEERESLLAKIHALEPEHVALKKLQTELERAAQRYASGVSYTLSASLVGTFGLYFWLSFIHFSWDIMEPVTYFTGFGVSIIGYTWWSLTNQEYEYENIYDYVYQKRLRKLMRQAGFDVAQLANVAQDIQDKQKQVAAIENVLTKDPTLQASYVHLLDNLPHENVAKK